MNDNKRCWDIAGLDDHHSASMTEVAQSPRPAFLSTADQSDMSDAMMADVAHGDESESTECPVRTAPGSGTSSLDVTPISTPQHASSSIFSRYDDLPVHNVPMRVINRPLPSELDEEKVLSFMEDMKSGDTFTPIEVMKVQAKLKTNPTGPLQTFFFALGGCHRYEACKRLGMETIRAKIIDVPPAQMRLYLGAGCPF